MQDPRDGESGTVEITVGYRPRSKKRKVPSESVVNLVTRALVAHPPAKEFEWTEQMDRDYRVVSKLSEALGGADLDLESLSGRRSSVVSKGVDGSEIDSLNSEIADNQGNANKVLYFSVIATAGFVSLTEKPSYYELTIGTGILLSAFVYLQTAFARKIFEISAFIAVCRDKTDSKVWHSLVPLIAASDRSRCWFMTQKIAIVYAGMALAYLYLFLPTQCGSPDPNQSRSAFVDVFKAANPWQMIQVEAVFFFILQAILVVWLWNIPIRRHHYQQRIRNCVRQGRYEAYLRWIDITSDSQQTPNQVPES